MSWGTLPVAAADRRPVHLHRSPSRPVLRQTACAQAKADAQPGTVRTGPDTARGTIMTMDDNARTAIWKRAAMVGGGSGPERGDAALASVLTFHGM